MKYTFQGLHQMIYMPPSSWVETPSDPSKERGLADSEVSAHLRARARLPLSLYVRLPRTRAEGLKHWSLLDQRNTRQSPLFMSESRNEPPGVRYQCQLPRPAGDPRAEAPTRVTKMAARALKMAASALTMAARALEFRYDRGQARDAHSF